jgi:hypothetical protein
MNLLEAGVFQIFYNLVIMCSGFVVGLLFVVAVVLLCVFVLLCFVINVTRISNNTRRNIMKLQQFRHPNANLSIVIQTNL